jgi:hypothetical protein
MGNVHVVVDLAAITQDGVAECAATHSGERADFNFIADHDRANVRQTHRLALRITLEAEPFFPYDSAGLDHAALPDHHFVADNRVVIDNRASAYAYPSAEHDVLPNACRRVDDGL